MVGLWEKVVLGCAPGAEDRKGGEKRVIQLGKLLLSRAA